MYTIFRKKAEAKKGCQLGGGLTGGRRIRTLHFPAQTSRPYPLEFFRFHVDDTALGWQQNATPIGKSRYFQAHVDRFETKQNNMKYLGDWSYCSRRKTTVAFVRSLGLCFKTNVISGIFSIIVEFPSHKIGNKKRHSCQSVMCDDYPSFMQMVHNVATMVLHLPISYSSVIKQQPLFMVE